jgi:hypothetical protein
VTTGILPTQTFRPDVTDGGADLEETDAYFYTGPVLSPEAELRAPRPSDAFGQWSWTHRQNVELAPQTLGKWAPEQALEGKDKQTDQPFQDPVWLREGWLKLVAHPLAIHNFHVEGVTPADDQETVLRFSVRNDADGYVLAWTASGADHVTLTLTGRSEPLFKSTRRPHPARYRVPAPTAESATYKLDASRADGTTQSKRIVVSITQV